MRTAPLALALIGLSACKDPAQGTFIGNPSLTARYVESELQQSRGGRLRADVVLQGCEGDEDRPLGAQLFDFQGDRATSAIQIPAGEHCGLAMRVEEFLVRFDGGDPNPTSVLATDFDLTVPGSFAATGGDAFTLRLGDAAWLSAMAETSAFGDNVLDGSNPALEAAFFEGLGRSGIELEQAAGASPPTPPEPLAGRLNLEDYPTSPLNTHSGATGCGPGTTYDVAVAIPPASMAAVHGLGAVGWCEGTIDFGTDLTPQTSTQVDYSDLSTFEVTYNGWDQSCGAVHCGRVYTELDGPILGSCTVLAYCDEQGVYRSTGFEW